MFKFRLISLITLFLLSIVHSFISAQQVNTLYFLENVPIRHSQNPAFQPTTLYYLSLPIIGYTHLSVGNNSLTLKDIIYNYKGQTISFLNPNGDVDRFYNTLKSNTVIHADLQTNLLSFGFKTKTAFWSFSLSEKIDGTIEAPKDFFKISIYGTPDKVNNSFDLNYLQSNFTAYTEAALGYANQINDKLSLGFKLKYLYGSENISNNNKILSIDAGVDKWTFKGVGSANESGPVQVAITDNIQYIYLTTPASSSSWLKPSGMGAGIDLGFDYKLNYKLNLSGAITDLGFLHWNKNNQNVNYDVDYLFDGVGQIDANQNYNSLLDVFNRLITSNSLVDSLSTAFQLVSNLNKSTNAYTTYTTAKLNLGFEYSLINNYLSLGLLSHSLFFKKTILEEIIPSINIRPSQWLNASVSYSLVAGHLSTIGAGFGLRTGFIHWFAAADFIPFQKASLSVSKTDPSFKIPIPYNSKVFNLSVGVNLVFNTLSFKNNEKNERSERSEGLKNATRNSDSYHPKSSKKNKSRTINRSNGLFRSKSKQNCNCDWN